MPHVRLGACWAAAWLALALPLIGPTAARLAAAPAAEEDAWDAFSADLSIRHAYVDAAGVIVQTPPPAVDMHVERRKSGGSWRTALTLTRIEKPAVRDGSQLITLDNPFLVVRMEYDGDGTAPRFFNVSGQRVALPDAAANRLLAVSPEEIGDLPVANLSSPAIVRGAVLPVRPDWIDNIVATPAKQSARQLAIEARFGRRRGRVNGLDRYLATAGGVTCEMLVNRSAAVPVEVNVVQSGLLAARTQYSHETRPDGVMIRRLLRAERVVSVEQGTRILSEITLTGVTVSAGAGQ